MAQYSITPSQLQRACQLIAEWEPEFERIFYQRRVDRIPFIHSCVHLMCHLALEATRVGLPICSSQWTMERTIGNLGQEIRQPSDPFSNLAQQGIRRCQVNALKAMIPHFDPPDNVSPCASADLRNGYVLLAKRDKHLTTVHGDDARVITDYLGLPHTPKIRRWACLRLPNGQIAWSEYQELQRTPEDICMARNVKVRQSLKMILTLICDTIQISFNGGDRIAEVRYFTRLAREVDDWHNANEERNAQDRLQFVDVALVTLYSNPHPHLLERSYGVLASCMKLGEESLQMIKITDI